MAPPTVQPKRKTYTRPCARCGRPWTTRHKATTLCSTCYGPAAAEKKIAEQKRWLRALVADATPDRCVEWPKYRNAAGHGVTSVAGKLQIAARAIWDLVVAPIPDGREVVHRCGNPGCVNPHHLDLGRGVDVASERRSARHEARFRALLAGATPDRCVEWPGCRRGAYGFTSLKSQHMQASRAAWTLANGPIPDGLWVLHRCDNPPCVNPHHLFLGTAWDNSADMIAKGRARYVLGAETGGTKLTEQDVATIREGGASNAQLGVRYGVTRAAIRAVRRGETWLQPYEREALWRCFLTVAYLLSRLAPPPGLGLVVDWRFQGLQLELDLAA